MKVAIRRGVFETNSSSTHCLTIIPNTREDKEYFNFKWEVEDGYFRIRFPMDLYFDTPFETFASKMAYLTILRIAYKHGCDDDYDRDKLRPVVFERSGELDEWFDAATARLKEMGIDIKGFELGYNYVNDTGKRSWEYDDDDYEDDPPLITKDTKITPKLKKMHLRWSVDHQVVDSKPDDTAGRTILIKTMYQDPWDEEQKEPKLMDVEFDADDPMSDLDILFNPRIGILYTSDNGGVRDLDKKVSIKEQIEGTK